MLEDTVGVLAKACIDVDGRLHSVSIAGFNYNDDDDNDDDNDGDYNDDDGNADDDNDVKD